MFSYYLQSEAGSGAMFSDYLQSEARSVSRSIAKKPLSIGKKFEILQKWLAEFFLNGLAFSNKYGRFSFDQLFFRPNGTLRILGGPIHENEVDILAF